MSMNYLSDFSEIEKYFSIFEEYAGRDARVEGVMRDVPPDLYSNLYNLCQNINDRVYVLGKKLNHKIIKESPKILSYFLDEIKKNIREYIKDFRITTPKKELKSKAEYNIKSYYQTLLDCLFVVSKSIEDDIQLDVEEKHISANEAALYRFITLDENGLIQFEPETICRHYLKIDMDKEEITKFLTYACLYNEYKLISLELIQQAKKEEELLNAANDSAELVARGKKIFNQIQKSQGVKYESSIFKFSNEYTKECTKNLIESFYNGSNVNLLLIEIVLYNHGQLQKRNSHKKFVLTLMEWGVIGSLDGNDIRKITNGMSDKSRKLPSIGYRSWPDTFINDKNLCIDIGKKLPESMKYID